jgi:tryptophanyl-tRNA synthetase
MLTTHFDRIPDIAENVRELVYDYLSVGIDPGKSTTASAGCVSARARYVPDGRSARG